MVRDTINRFGQVGIMVTHVGFGPLGRPSEFSDETIMEAMEHNFLSAIRLTREVTPYMKQLRWGRIVHLLPLLHEQMSDGTALSVSSQLALVGYSKMLANELAPFNITVNNLVLGPVQTEYLTSTLESRAHSQGRSSDEVINETILGIPIGRMGKPEEVGDLVAFLGSERAAYLTGTSVVLDGGMLQAIS